MSRFVAAAFALVLASSAVACTDTDNDEFRTVQEFENGMALDSDSGAFRIVLNSDDRVFGVGRNDLVVRVGFHDPNNPLAEGRGIPNAQLSIDAWKADADTSMVSEVALTELGDGYYSLDNVVLTEEGVWNVDLDIVVGDGMHETVSLAFDVIDYSFRSHHDDWEE